MPSISFPLYMLACLGLTIIVEILVALIIKIRTKMDLIHIVLVNVMTNPVIVALTNLISINYGYSAGYTFLYIAEVFVVLIEGFVYKKYLDYKKINPFVLALLLNVCSYIAGVVMNYFI